MLFLHLETKNKSVCVEIKLHTLTFYTFIAPNYPSQIITHKYFDFTGSRLQGACNCVCALMPGAGILRDDEEPLGREIL